MSIGIDDKITISFLDDAINVNGEKLFFFSIVKPEKIKNIPNELIEQINWKWYGLSNICYYEDVLFGQKYREITLTDEDWETCVKPFADQWQAEKDRIEQEQQNTREEYAKFANRQERALTKITEDYSQVLERGFVRTSLGFDADISCDSSATLLGTQTSLAYTMRTLGEGDGIPKTIFRDFYGLKRELDVVQVERLICEINGAQNHIREQKHLFKGRVKDETSDNESLNAVLSDCVYSTLDFSNLDEVGKPAELPFVETKSLAERIDAPYL